MDPIGYNDVAMQQLTKRLKPTKELVVMDIASIVHELAESVESMSNSCRSLLKVNKAVVVHCLEIQKREKELAMEELETGLQQL